MTKAEMLADPNSCWNKAADDEPVFVLLARDIAAPQTVEDWRLRRVQYGKNKVSDADLADARKVAAEMKTYRKTRTARGGDPLKPIT